MITELNTTKSRPSASSSARWGQRTLAAAGLTILISGTALSGIAHADETDLDAPIQASATAVLSFERPLVKTIDTTPKKPASINVQSSIEAVKRPMPKTLSAPLVDMRLTSPFGHRTSPINGDPTEEHLGQDFGAACGTPVFAADSGKVVFSGWHEYGGGNRVEIDHGNGITTSYNHMEHNALKVDDIVDVGAIVGKVGTTGSSTGCHLHFETIKDGKDRVDPMGWQLIPIIKK
jgi:murein DD-endopeptidase MepM/ murein hydrolase activator NlpD